MPEEKPVWCIRKAVEYFKSRVNSNLTDEERNHFFMLLKPFIDMRIHAELKGKELNKDEMDDLKATVYLYILNHVTAIRFNSALAQISSYLIISIRGEVSKYMTSLYKYNFYTEIPRGALPPYTQYDPEGDTCYHLDLEAIHESIEKYTALYEKYVCPGDFELAAKVVKELVWRNYVSANKLEPSLEGITS